MALDRALDKKKKRQKTIIDDNKLYDLNQNYLRRVKNKAFHRQCDLEEIRMIERFERRCYSRGRKQKKETKNETADSARAKWKGLRDTFRGELRKVNKTIANGTPCKSTNWEYFNEMLFVKDQIYSNRRNLVDTLQAQHRKAAAAAAAAESSVEEGNNSTGIADLCKQEVVEGGQEIEAQATSETDNSITSMRLVVDPQTPVAQSLVQAQAHAHVHATDDDYNFLMSILPQLRTLPTMRNLYVRLKIQELLYSEIVALQETT